MEFRGIIFFILFYAEEKKHIEAYEALVHTFEAVHVDNLKILRSLINPKAAEILPLFDGNTRKRVETHHIAVPV
jgi:hypothetical protein